MEAAYVLKPEECVTGPLQGKVVARNVSNELVIAAYNHQDKSRIIGRFSDPSNSTEFGRMLGSIQLDGNASRLEVTVSGMADALDDQRDYPIAALADIGVPLKHIARLYLRSEQEADITVDTSTAKMLINLINPKAGEAYDPPEPDQAARGLRHR